MYGYHPEEEQFLKIYLYNPNNVRKAADLMLGGAVMNKPFQPHESHIPYALQLFIDYNLYGMNLVNVAALKFRQQRKDKKSDSQDKTNSSPQNVSTGSLLASSSSFSSLPENHTWNVENIPSELLLPDSVERQSVCELEVDVVAADILNRQELTNSIGANPGLASLWEDERQRCRGAGESSQIEPEPSQDSKSSSEGTVILDNENEETVEDVERDDRPIISLDSIKKVVSLSQSFSNGASQKDSQDHSVADILASLLEEAGPASSQVISLEEKDSVLNQSILRDEEYDEEDDKETLLMSQSLQQNDKDERLSFTALKNEAQQGHTSISIAMDTDEDDDEIDLLPQFDGASDHVSRAKKTSDSAHNLAETSNQNLSSPENSSQQMPGQMTADSLSLTPRQDMSQWTGDKSHGQGYPSDHSSGFSHSQQGTNVWPGSMSNNWQGQSPMWQQQQQRVHNWSPQHQQQAPVYPQQQTPFRATSPFHSPPHNSFASPGHISSGFQTSSPSVNQHRSPFQYPGGHAQSPSSSQQQYASQAYQSPYQSPASSNHNYQQSPQPYQSPTTPGAQSYQSPMPYACKPYPSGTSYQGSGYQSSPSSQIYQSPTYHPGSSNGGQIYQSPYQSPHQAYPPSYSTPGYNTQQQSGWSPRRDFQGYFQPGPPGVPQQQQQQQQQSPANCPAGASMHSHSGGNSQTAPGHCGDHTTSQACHSGSFSNSTPFSSSHDSTSLMEDTTKTTSKSQQSQQHISSSSSLGVAGQRETNLKKQASDVSEDSESSQKLEGISKEFKSPNNASSHPSESVTNKEIVRKPLQPQTASYARALPRPTTSTKSLENAVPDQLEKSATATPSQPNADKSYSSPSNKISTLDFNPVSSTANTFNSGTVEKLEEKPVGVDASATPMIQQLLMEESPARKNIKPKDRLAASAAGMRKPMPSPNPPKPKKKSKIKSSPHEAKPPGRPRSSSASSPAHPMMDFRGGFSPHHSTMVSQHHMQSKAGRSQSISLPFNNDPGMVRSPQAYGWNQPSHISPQQMQWRHSYPAWQQHHHYHPQPQQQQQPHLWGNNQWQDFPNPASYGNGGIAKDSTENQNFTPARMQNRSYSADAALSPSYTGSMSSRHPSQSDSQSSEQGSCIDNQGNASWHQGSSACGSKGDLSGNIKDTSSLSSLLQLVSDVGSSSDETGWDNVVTNLSKNQHNGNGDINSKKSSNSESTSQASPSVKDFITLETPVRPNDKSNGSCISFEEFDQTEEESTSDNKVSTKVHPRLGKQNRLKRMGPKLSRAGELGLGDNADTSETVASQPKRSESVAHNSNTMSPNPWYTYTFHVPTPVFKKLKFYQSAHARRQTVKVVRMHPMDARRYSLLKIGREVVRVARLTPQELRSYNVTFPPPSQYVSSDGSSNRVNLDIPTGSGDSHNGDGTAEEGSISFDTDFPPNKVAPPSSFDSSHVTASVQRSVAPSSNRGSPRSGSPGAASAGGLGDWTRQSDQHQQQYGFCGYNGGGLSSSRISNNLYSSQGPGVRPQQGDYAYNHQHQEQGLQSYSAQRPIPPGNTDARSFTTGPVGFSMYGGQKMDEYPPITPSTSGLNNPVSYNSNYHSGFVNNTSYPYPHHYHQQQQQQVFCQPYQQTHQQQQQQYQLQQQQHHHHHQQFHPLPQTDHSSSGTEQKNELRSPGQHGLASKIDSEGTQSHSGVYTSASGALSVNTWVNARINHADSRANIKDESRSFVDQVISSQPSQPNSDDGGWTRNKADLLTKEAYHKKKKIRRKKRGSLSLKKSKRESDGIEAFDSLDGSANSDTDKEAPSSYFTQLKTDANGDLPTKIVLKNIKSLRLKIPRPYSECTNNNGSLDLVGEEDRDPVSDSHEQLSDVSNKTYDSVQTNVDSQSEASKGRTSQQGCRKAKLRSIYSSQRPGQRKQKKRKEKPEPLKEGVHYIIIGKFKGYKSMLVKIKKAPVLPGEIVCAEKFDKMSAKDIVRQVKITPIPLGQNIRTNYGDIPGSPEFKHQVPSVGFDGSQSIDNTPEELPSRSERQGKRRQKFKSAYVKNLKTQGYLGSEDKSLINNRCPKNGEAGLMRVEAMTNNNTNILSSDIFFTKVREAFLHHSQLQDAAFKESPPVKVQFFEGVSYLQLSAFKKKLAGNLTSSISDDYSSSSDEEEDILDGEILHQKLYPNKLKELSDSNMLPLNVIECEKNPSSILSDQKIEEADYGTSVGLAKPSCGKEIFNLKPYPTNYCNSELSTFPLQSYYGNEETIGKISTSKAIIQTPKENIKDDFLKRQMAFFEDISSTSESESEVKREVGKSQLSPKCPPLRLSVGSNGIKILRSADNEQQAPVDSNKLNSQFVPEREECKISKPEKNSEENVPCDGESKGNTNIVTAPINMSTSVSSCEESNKANTSPKNDSNLCSRESRADKCEKHVDKIHEKNWVIEKEHVSEGDVKNNYEPAICQDERLSLIGDEDLEVPCTKNTIPDEPEKIETQTACAVSGSISSKRSKKQGKNRKRSALRKDKAPSRRIQLGRKESSSNDEAQADEEKISGFERKRLRQRKQTGYRFYSEDLDTSEDEIWGIEESSCSKEWSNLTHQSKCKKPVPALPDIQDTHRSSKNSALNNSRRRKGTGGGKLLNSLSLLHMATIANLTDAQQDSLDGSLSTSREATSTPTEQYSDKANGDCFPEYTPSLETLSFISPKTSDETEGSPPIAVSPTDRKVQDQARSAGQSRTSRQLFHSVHRRTNLKPGCNGSSNLGTRPLHFSHSVNESASSSPVPSNFPVSENVQSEDTPLVNDNCENSNAAITATATVHQLLETRKAQVNCASFSMKDILRLATPDDSMDSDSKDSAAVVKPPEVRRAQVRSTSLSMSDILQLTKSSSPAEETTGLHHSLTVAKGLGNQLLQNDNEPVSEASSSLLSQMAEFFPSSVVKPTELSAEELKEEEKPCNNFELGLKRKGNGKSTTCEFDVKQTNRKPINIQTEHRLKSLSNPPTELTSNDKQNEGKIEKNKRTNNSSDITKKEMQALENSGDKAPGSESTNCEQFPPHVVLDERKWSCPFKKQDETDGDTYRVKSKSPSPVVISSVPNENPNKIFSSSSSSSKVSQAYSVSSSTPRLPEILVTHDEKVDNLKCNKSGEQLNGQSRELNPLNPLQIPTYPYLAWPPAHPFPSAPASDSPMFRHPDYWHWLAQHGSSTSSPLNLCTTAHRSPNSYSPITPTSPVSPYYPTQAPMITPVYCSSLSPPAKKSKPLWYPWLNIESSKSDKPCQQLASPSAYNSKNNSIESLSKKTKEQYAANVKEAGKPTSLRHSIADLLASPAVKSPPLKVNKEALSSCETVSQFLGSVIDTAYSRHSKTKHENVSRNSNKESFAFSEQHTRPSSVPDFNSSVKSDSMHHRSQAITSGWYPNQEKLATFQRLSFSQDPNCRVPTGPFSGVRKGEADRVRAMLENEMALRGQFGLPPVRPMASVPNTSSDSQSLTARLVSQLIRGNERDDGNKEPVDGSRSRKRAAGPSGSRNEGSGTSKTNNDKIKSGKRKGSDNFERDDRGKREDKGKRKLDKSSLDRCRSLIIRPVTFPPPRKSVEENSQDLGLKSIQPPKAFCSDEQDLPDKPMEHGGRVLKVESNRTRDIATFPCSEQLNGIQSWRQKSLTRLGPHTRIVEDAQVLSALENSSKLRMLLEPDRSIVACPALVPPARASVVAWLSGKMSVVLDNEKTKQQGGPNYHSEETNQGGSHDNVKFSQEDQTILSTQKVRLAANTIGRQKPVDCLTGVTSPLSSDQGIDEDSTLMDTDLDISCTPSQTPRPLLTQSESQVQKTLGISSNTLKDTQVASVEGKLSATSQSPSTSQTLDVHFRKSKRRNIFASPDKTKQGKFSAAQSNLGDAPFASSDSLQSPAAVPSLLSPTLYTQPDRSEAGDVTSDAANQVTPLLKRVSTNTENLLRKNVLSHQTQRQHSDLGFTAAEVSQIEGPTPKNTFGFKVTQNQIQGAKARHKYQNITTLSLELHVETRGDLRPDPELDPIQAIFYSVLDDVPAERGKRSVTGIIIVDAESWTSVASRQQVGVPQALQKSKPNLNQGSPSPSKGDVSNPDHTPPSSPKPVASQSPSPKPKKGGKGKGRGGKTRGQSPVRPSSVHSGSCSAQALLEKCSVGRDLEVTYVQDEWHLLGTLIDLVTRFDPDILVGYEIQMLSWGFLLQRGAHLGLDMCSKIARVQDSKENNQFSASKDEWGADHMSEIHVSGRVVLNLWRIIRHEVALNVYTFENVAFHILHQRIPLYSFRSLTKWFSHKTHLPRWRVLEHYIIRVKGQLEIIDSLDLIGKTSEFARVFGIEFYDVLARGSQIRVESMMLRLAKPLNYVPVSPSVNQRARQRAPECIPLTLEPESQLYTSPVVVLDFQSLYPSIMIAYNYCFSTCLGRLSCLESAHEGPFEFGCTSLKVTPASLKKLHNHVTVSPNGVVFLKSNVRRGVLPRMVEEILNTRIMVKKSMKSVKGDKTMSRMLDARQLGLKLIANVTYGYTGASFSGRMPCIEVGDSIVRKARESLERAIELVHSTPRWGAQVVYGDTDSLFIHFPGRTKDEAFVIGHEIADAVTAMFPSPMKLKFEKVYLPCVLQTKKRYVGFMYETPDQKEPVFDAKGIETVRRDSCSAVSKILERSIKLMFSTYDLSRVRAYVTRQLHKLLEGKVSVLDLIFAKEFRGSLGYKPGACVPALEIARRRVRVDRRWEPRVGERVPYIIVHGPPGLPLIQLVREPHDLTLDSALRLNATYYITKQILPPLDRLFSLIGVNVFKWYQDMPKVVRLSPMIGVAPSVKQGTISQFFATTDCPVCDVQTKKPVCEKCAADPQLVTWTVMTRLRTWERTYSRLMQVCITCQGTQDAGNQTCISTDCPVMFRRIIAHQDLTRADNLKEVLNKYLCF
ncbi:DNA polymerase zeta catalytic subunit-like [Elysia marginata]|uniref:DNA polymerase zeta catalytic subunit n=1 Tax=Elysia marginata TaxID=1093978 RepID=A0AAV4IUU1_9GAST|nr:DNA polymerase zeta catalytic subunit-like [Elysia marginata]